MDSLRDERGQSLLLVVLALAIAAVAVIGLRATQERLHAATLVRRAGEAAVEAAAQSVADAYIAHLETIRARSRETPRPTPNVRGLLADPRTIEAARTAAEELARDNGAAGVEGIELFCAGSQIETRLVLAGYAHHAGVTAPECSQR